ncbi:MAG: cation:proton antiporter [Leptospirales bacterium]
MHTFIQDIGIAIIVATLMGVIAHRLKQPIILAYLIAGIIVGPAIGSSFIHDIENIKVIAEIGLILLLFIIGLEMNPSHLKKEFKTLLLPGIMQFPLVLVLSMGTFALIGYGYQSNNFDLLYLAVGVSFSSTAIVVKILNDNFELNTLSGKASIGMLIFQDLWAILFLALQPNLDNPEIVNILSALGRVALLLISGLIVSRFILKPLFQRLSLAPEMLVSVGMGWCALMAGYGKVIGLSMEMGALVAGVTLASFPYSVHITSKVAPLRDFFLTLFFISLGMEIPFPQFSLIQDAVLVVVIALLARPFIFYPVLRLGGSGKRTAFVASLNLAQISEFALVIAAIGLKLNHISGHVMSTLLYAMSITSILGSYIIKYNRQLFNIYDKLTTTILGKVETPAEEIVDDVRSITVLGYHRGAHAFIHWLVQVSPDLLAKVQIIDFNSEYHKELESLGVKFIVGDIASSEALEHAHVNKSDIIISTIPDFLLKGVDNEKLIRLCRVLAPNAFIYANAEYVNQIAKMIDAGANEVILPYAVAGETIANDVLRIYSKLNPDYHNPESDNRYPPKPQISDR